MRLLRRRSVSRSFFADELMRVNVGMRVRESSDARGAVVATGDVSGDGMPGMLSDGRIWSDGRGRAGSGFES
jgi:hypothetical protein